MHRFTRAEMNRFDDANFFGRPVCNLRQQSLRDINRRRPQNDNKYYGQHRSDKELLAAQLITCLSGEIRIARKQRVGFGVRRQRRLSVVGLSRFGFVFRRPSRAERKCAAQPGGGCQQDHRFSIEPSHGQIYTLTITASEHRYDDVPKVPMLDVQMACPDAEMGILPL